MIVSRLVAGRAVQAAPWWSQSSNVLTRSSTVSVGNHSNYKNVSHGRSLEYRYMATTTTPKDEAGGDHTDKDHQKAAVRKAKVARVQLKALPKSSVPERPPTAYILFAQEVRKQIMDDLTSGESKPTFVQIANAIGKKWKETDESEKEKYSAKASELRKIYDNNLSKYLANRSPLDLVVEQYRTRLLKSLNPAKRSPPRKFKDPNAPAHPLSAYGCFFKEVWASGSDAQTRVLGKSLEGLPVSEAGSLLGATWKKMTDSDKEKYVVMAKKASEEYASAKKAYEGTLLGAREELHETLKEAVAKSPGLKTKRGGRARKSGGAVVKKAKTRATANPTITRKKKTANSAAKSSTKKTKSSSAPAAATKAKKMTTKRVSAGRKRNVVKD
ncbi:hypothetical protein SmJEL517_g00254 [Synchytrium microbalum]|uniref:HMG box domain-containing protein n=1 Tax=Synchytrium microbalum TaxID=1806994 RepID=A0A507CF29_9FUNG|nr:uncharacterized protein SmJEL517_g00254 [Synchytrium microbalum]TPX37968.1 hypothetical protein SmJEL517_g00254 [Synchytrium microbalum]